MRTIFPISNLNLISVSVKPSPLVLSLQNLVPSPSSAFLEHPQVLKDHPKVSPEIFLLQAAQSQFSQPSLLKGLQQPGTALPLWGVRLQAGTLLWGNLPKGNRLKHLEDSYDRLFAQKANTNWAFLQKRPKLPSVLCKTEIVPAVLTSLPSVLWAEVW